MREKIVNFFINCLEDDLLVDEITKINKTEDLFKFYQKYNSDCTEEEFNTVIEEILKMSELDENSLEKVSGGLSGKRATSTALSVAMLATPFLAPNTKAGKVIENSNGYVFKKVSKDEDKEKSFLKKHWGKITVGAASLGALTLWGCSKFEKSDNQTEIPKGSSSGSGTRNINKPQTPPYSKKYEQLMSENPVISKLDVNDFFSEVYEQGFTNSINKCDTDFIGETKKLKKRSNWVISLKNSELSDSQNVFKRIHVVKGNIADPNPDWKLDCIVNAANYNMRGGSGVDGAVHSGAGYKDLSFYENKYRLVCPTGHAIATPAFALENKGIKKIIHTVAPDNRNKSSWRKCFNKGRSEAYKEVSERVKELCNCYLNCIQLAKESGCKRIGFVALGVGVFNCDLDIATKMAWETVAHTLDEEGYKDIEVYFVCYDNPNDQKSIEQCAIYKKIGDRLLPDENCEIK